MIYKSPVGKIQLTADEEALTGLYFAEENAEGLAQAPNRIIEQCMRELDAYFKGILKSFTVPVRAAGTPFRQRVWAELARIPYGQTITYGELAARIGQPRAARAAGGANHHNPVSIIIPCHRVIGADGSLTGYGGGMERKRFLLELEQG